MEVPLQGRLFTFLGGKRQTKPRRTGCIKAVLVSLFASFRKINQFNTKCKSSFHLYLHFINGFLRLTAEKEKRDDYRCPAADKLASTLSFLVLHRLVAWCKPALRLTAV